MRGEAQADDLAGDLVEGTDDVLAALRGHEHAPLQPVLRDELVVLRRRDLPQRQEVDLVAHEVHVRRRGVLPHDTQPVLQVAEAFRVGDVVDQEDRVRAPNVRRNVLGMDALPANVPHL